MKCVIAKGWNYKNKKRNGLFVLIISKDYFFGGGGAGGGGAGAGAGAEGGRYYTGLVANTSCEIWVLFVNVCVFF